MVQVSKVSLEYVDFHAKMSLIFYPAFGNSITKRTLMSSNYAARRIKSFLRKERVKKNLKGRRF